MNSYTCSSNALKDVMVAFLELRGRQSRVLDTQEIESPELRVIALDIHEAMQPKKDGFSRSEYGKSLQSEWKDVDNCRFLIRPISATRME